jgi:phospholipid/cholesterol/gamma-HCH transport system substrate-binding protein
VSTESKVGTFVTACLALLGASIYFVGNAQWGHHFTPYKTYLSYAGGVAQGSEVLFGGIAVGRVTAVRSSVLDPTRIEILIEMREGTPVNEKCIAKLGSVSLMSSPAISITTGAKGARRLAPNEVISSHETVSIDDMTRKLSDIADSADALIAQVQDELKGISGKAQTLLANLNDATGSANRKQVAEILQEMNSMVARQSPKVDRITDQVLAATRDADSAIQRVGPLVDQAGVTVANANSAIDQLRDPIKQDLAQLQATLEQARSLMTNVQNLVRGNDDNIRETLENLRVASENLDQLTGQVKQNPWSLVRIRQPKDRKVPQVSTH